MYTLGYDFVHGGKRKPIADGPSILRYIRETARTTGSIAKFGTPQVKSGAVVVRGFAVDSRGGPIRPVRRLGSPAISSICASGYYDYAGDTCRGWPGMGEISRADRPPTKWPKNLVYKRQARRRDWQRSHVG